MTHNDIVLRIEAFLDLVAADGRVCGPLYKNVDVCRQWIRETHRVQATPETNWPINAYEVRNKIERGLQIYAPTPVVAIAFAREGFILSMDPERTALSEGIPLMILINAQWLN